MCIADPKFRGSETCRKPGEPPQQSRRRGSGSAAVPARGPRSRGPPRPSRALHSEPRALHQQLLSRMQRVSSGLPNGSQSASRCASVAFTEQNQVATLPVQQLTDDVAAMRDNVHAEDGFQMKMYAHGFTPEELVVQVDGGCLMVTGQRQLEGCSPDGSGFRMAQKVHQQMPLPPGLDPAAMTCCLTPSGQLCVRGQCRALPCPEAQTGPAPRLRSRGSKKGSKLA
ncbi:heat shock protein beta-9 [Sus scrofa]|nr:heat shock protein beta-9 [Sus scrofa]